ncbi:MAG: PIN domain-containing protein [Actinomycetota bacterium]
MKAATASLAPLEGPHLADSTVWSKVRSSRASGWADWFNLEVREGRIFRCEPVCLEILRSARDTASFSEQSAMLNLLEDCPIGPKQWKRARDVQALLAARSQHRSVPPQDFLIAAAAESAEIPLLHYDHDYDLIADVTGQEARWLAPTGSIP